MSVSSDVNVDKADGHNDGGELERAGGCHTVSLVFTSLRSESVQLLSRRVHDAAPLQSGKSSFGTY